jgi:ubiquinone/menaquinone biosynthesis C-methylase UbiE
VYAVDIQQEMLDEIERRKRDRDTDNIETILGRIDDPGLGEQSADLVFIVDAYHEFSHPREMGEAIFRALRPGGHLIVVEDRAEDGLHSASLHNMTEKQARKEITALGFTWLRTETFLPQQHFLVFRKPASP